MSSYSRVWADVDLDAVRHNMEEFRRNVRKDAVLCGVVKTDGYGLGAVPVAKTIEDLVWGYAVAEVEEAVNLRRHGIGAPILVLGYVPQTEFARMAEQQIRYTGYQEEMLAALSDAACRIGRKAFVHIKVDTGMSRIGVPPSEAAALVRKACAMPGLFVEGLFTHLATADMLADEPARRQERAFAALIEELKEQGICPPICHCGNSAAAIRMTESVGDMFRIGISLYGYYPSDEVERDIVELRPAMELKSTVAYVKSVLPGTAVGYGGTFVTDRETVIATVPVGYGDGYPRALSNKGYMLIRGQRAPIIGRVCMDQLMLDVTDIRGVSAQDRVTLIGKDGGSEITVEEIAALAGSFNYEFLCDLGKRIPRVYHRHGRIVGSKDYFQDDYRDFC